jgi:hypothetical protein
VFGDIDAISPPERGLMETAEIRKAIVWGCGAFILTEIHPVSIMTGLIITLIASVIGALN